MTAVPAHGHVAHGGDGARTPGGDYEPVVDGFARRALLGAAAGAVLLLLGFVIHGGREFFQAYLYAFLIFTGLSLGCMALLMLQHLVGGAWGALIRRPLEAGARLLPLMAVLFIPVVFGMGSLYEWLDAGWRQRHADMTFKLWWLTREGFILRGVIYFVLWILLSFVLVRWSDEQDRTGDPWVFRRMQLFSGPGLVVYVATVTFASVDWAMSLDPTWVSTMYGLLFVVGQALTTLALVVLLLTLVYERRPFHGVVTIGHFHDLGNLLLAFVMLWAYLNFSQFLIIWQGNVAEETPYYIARTHGGWKYVGLALVLFHWFVPFVLLLWRQTKRNPRALAGVALAVLVMRLLDMLWLLGPSFPRDAGTHGSHAAATAAGAGRDLAVSATQAATQAAVDTHGAAHDAVVSWWHAWMYPAAAAAIGGVWLYLFVRQLKRRPILAPHDRRLVPATGGHH